MKKNKFSYKQFFLVVVLIFLVIFIWNPFNLAQGMRTVVFKVTSPIQKTFYFLGLKTKEFNDFWRSISSLHEENERLLKENNNIRKRLAVLENIKRENEELRSQLELAPWENFNLETAFVIGQNSLGSGSWILIDKGENQGIKKGMPAVVYEGILVGKVEEVYPDSARVILLSDPKSVINVKDTETGTRGLVRGEYGLGIFLDMVEQREAINKGDLLVTSGLGGEIPENLLVGEIQEVKNSSDKLFQQAIVSSRVKYSDLETVLIIKN